MIIFEHNYKKKRSGEGCWGDLQKTPAGAPPANSGRRCRTSASIGDHRKTPCAIYSDSCPRPRNETLCIQTDEGTPARDDLFFPVHFSRSETCPVPGGRDRNVEYTRSSVALIHS